MLYDLGVSATPQLARGKRVGFFPLPFSPTPPVAYPHVHVPPITVNSVDFS